MSTFARPQLVQIDYLTNNPYQPRLTIDPVGLAPLVESIRRFGFLGHLEARRDPGDPGKPLQLVFGHRRVRAAELAGLRSIPIVIVDRSDEEMQRIGFVENDTVEALTYWEQAVFLNRLKQESGWTIEELANQLVKTKGWVQNRLDVLRLPDGPVREAARTGEITMTAALVLLSMSTEEQIELLDRLQRGEINSDDLKAIRQARSRSAEHPFVVSKPTVAVPSDATAAPVSPAETQPMTSADHARWVLRHLETTLRLVRRHASQADFTSLSAPEATRLAALRDEVLGLFQPPGASRPGP